MGADTQEFASLPEAHWCYLTFENEEFSHPVTLQCRSGNMYIVALGSMVVGLVDCHSLDSGALEPVR